MKNIVPYFGYLGANNIGDEALYLSAQKLFDGIQFVDRRYTKQKNIAFFGGGTRIPPIDNEASVLDEYSNKIAFGVGIKNTSYRNRKYAPVDLGYYSGKYNFKGLVNRPGIEYALRPLDHLSDSFSISGDYLRPSDFTRLRDFDSITVRGPKSKKICDSYDIDCDIIGDPALILESTANENRKSNIAVNVRPGKNKWTADTSYRSELIEVCQGLSRDHTIILLPFQPEDIPACLEVARSIPGAKFRDYCSHIQVQNLLDEIAQCKLMIGERLHANVLSAAVHTPFISMEYQPKNADFAASLDWDEHNINISSLAAEELSKKANKLLQENESNISHLQESVSKKREQLQISASEINQKWLTQ